MIKKEFLLFMKKKYYIIIVLCFLFILCSFLLNNTEGGSKSYFSEDLDSDYCYYIRKYESKAELRSIIDEYKAILEDEKNPFYNEYKADCLFKLNIHIYLYDNDIPYDGVEDYREVTLGQSNKHTPFSFFGTFSRIMCIFALLVSCSIGSIVPTIDFQQKTAKLVFSSGEKRGKTVFRKYCVSLFNIMIASFLALIIAALVALVFKKKTIQECFLIFGNQLIFMNYFQFVILQMANYFVFLIVVYTIVFYFSLIVKNTVAALSINLSCLFGSWLLNIDINDSINVLKTMSTYGIMAFCDIGMYETKPILMLWFLAYLVILISMVVCGNILLNKRDCTR